MKQKIREYFRKAMIFAAIMSIFTTIAAADVVDDMFAKQDLFQKLLNKLSTPIGKLIGIAMVVIVLMILIVALGQNPETKEELVKAFWSVTERIAVVMTWRVAIIICIVIILGIWGYTLF